MTTTGTLDDTRSALHNLLLRAAGRAPDGLVSGGRVTLAAADLRATAQFVAFALRVGRLPVTAADESVLTAAAGEDAAGVAELLDGSVDPPATLPAYRMAPVGPDEPEPADDALPYCLDLTPDGPGPTTPVGPDAAAVAAARSTGACRAVWRAWRTPVAPAAWLTPKRIYLVQAECAHDAELPALTGAVQTALTAAGEPEPQVEVFLQALALPGYQRDALSRSALLWTAAATGPVRMAALYPGLDAANVPTFGPAHPRLTDGERDRVARYLDTGALLVRTERRTTDVVDPARGAVVPMSFHTDGRWIWTDAAAYYLRRYALAPDAGLLEHIRRQEDLPGPVDALGLHRAMSALRAALATGRVRG